MMHWMGGFLAAQSDDIVKVDVIGGTLNHVSLSPSDASVTYSLTNAGAERGLEGAVLDINNTWLLIGAAGDYECRLTVNSGNFTPTGDANGSWLSLSSTRSWQVTKTSAGLANSAGCTIEIRDATTLVVLDSATITMIANEEL